MTDEPYSDEPYSDEAARLAPNPQSARLREIPCDHCNGTGWVKLIAEDTQTQRMVTCGSCMGRGTVQRDDTRPGYVEAAVRRDGGE